MRRDPAPRPAGGGSSWRAVPAPPSPPRRQQARRERISGTSVGRRLVSVEACWTLKGYRHERSSFERRRRVRVEDVVAPRRASRGNGCGARGRSVSTRRHAAAAAAACGGNSVEVGGGGGGGGGQARQNRPAGLMSAASGARQSAVYPSPDQGTDADRRPARGPRQGAAPARAPSAAAPPRCRRVCRPRACVLADVAPAVAAESAPKAQAYCLRSGPVGSRWGARREKAPRNRPPRKLRKQAVSGPPQVRPPRSRRPPAEIFEAL